MSEYPDHIERGLRAARRATAPFDGDLPAQMQAAVDYSLSQLDPSLANLEQALGVKIDGGAFLLGMQAAAFAYDNTDMLVMASMPTGKQMFLQMLTRGRER